MSKEKREEELNDLFEIMRARNASAKEIDEVAQGFGVDKSQQRDWVSEPSMTLYPAQPDREYSGEVIGFQDDSAIQETSPGVAVEHRGIASAMCQDDIGKSFSISYDGQGNVQVKELGAERGREKDIER